MSLSRIHLSFDVWTSPNNYAIICVYFHFIDSKGKRQTRLAAFKRIHGAHTGENQALALLAVIRDFQIEQAVGCFMCDNAKDNDGAVDFVLEELYPNMAPKQRKGRRLRCLDHIANLPLGHRNCVAMFGWIGSDPVVRSGG